MASSSSSSFEGAIEWSRGSRSMRQLVENCGGSNSLPVLCRATSGYSGCDEELLQIGSGETFWVFDIHKQQRLVVQTAKADCYLSIPIDYPTRVQIVQQEGSKKVGQSVPIREVFDAVKSSSGISTPAVRLIFEGNCTVSFQIGANLGGSAKFDVLTAQQVYDEKYLLAHSVCNRRIYSSVHAIPVFLPIEFSVAMGFSGRDAQAWSHWTEEIAQLTKTFRRSAFRTTQEIILFNKKPSDGLYDYIRLSDFSKFKENDKIFSSGIGKRDKETTYEEISWQTNQDSTTTRRTDCDQKRNHSVSLSRIPPPLPRHSGGKTVVQPLVSIYPPSTKPPASLRTLPPTPPVPSQGPKLGRVKVLPDPGVGSVGAYESLDSAAMTPSSSSPSFHLYASLSDVPADIDFGKLTVEEVAECLQLLRLRQHCDAFRKRQIDGGMVMSLTEKMLVEEFQFRSFDATQFLLFAKKKWRPKRANTPE